MSPSTASSAGRLPWMSLKTANRMSGTARGTAAALCGGLAGADERARELAFDFRRQAVHIHTALGQERARIGDLVDAPRFDLDIRKTGGPELCAVFLLLEGPGNAADP